MFIGFNMFQRQNVYGCLWHSENKWNSEDILGNCYCSHFSEANITQIPSRLTFRAASVGSTPDRVCRAIPG